MIRERAAELYTRGQRFWWWAQCTHPWRTISHFTNVGGSVLAAGMSYQALFAVFAGLWLGFSVFGIVLVSQPELLESLIEQLNTFVPGLIGDQGALVKTSDLLGLAGTFGWSSAAAAVALIWVALNWFTGTRRAIRIIFGLDVKQYRNAVLLKLRDFVLALLFALAILLSATLTVLSSNATDWAFEALNWSPESWLLGTVGTLARYGAMYVFDVILLVAMHRVLAEVRAPRTKLLWGCALGALALLGLKIGGAALLGGASNNTLLATFALFIGVLIWFNFVCRVLLLTASWVATRIDSELGRPMNGRPADG